MDCCFVCLLSSNHLHFSHIGRFLFLTVIIALLPNFQLLIFGNSLLYLPFFHEVYILKVPTALQICPFKQHLFIRTLIFMNCVRLGTSNPLIILLIQMHEHLDIIVAFFEWIIHKLPLLFLQNLLCNFFIFSTHLLVDWLGFCVMHFERFNLTPQIITFFISGCTVLEIAFKPIILAFQLKVTQAELWRMAISSTV